MADSSIFVLSLCSGTSMLDEGVRCAIPEARIVGYVEREAFVEALLLARMAEACVEPAPVWCGNLEDFHASEWRGAVDCITAGFPCQPWSAAGKQLGVEDQRWIWPAIAGIIGEIEPSLVFLENVPGLASGRGLNRVLGDFAALGLDAEWCHLAAADVGASHQRERIFILAVDSRRGCGVLWQSPHRCERLADRSDADMGYSASRQQRREQNQERESCEGRSDSSATSSPLANTGIGQFPLARRRAEWGDGLGSGSASLAHAARGQREQLRRTIAEPRGRLCGSDGRGEHLADDPSMLGRTEQRSESHGILSLLADTASPRFSSGEDSRANTENAREKWRGCLKLERDCGTLADRDCTRLEGQRDRPALQESSRPSDRTEIFAPGPTDKRWEQILARTPWLAPAIESGVRGLVDGHAVVLDESRTDQLRAIGNGVVALQAAVAFRVLAERLGVWVVCDQFLIEESR